MNIPTLHLRSALMLSLIALPLHAQTGQQPSIFAPTVIPLPPGSPQPVAPVAGTPIQAAIGTAPSTVQSNCELLASNTVRAKLQDIRRVPLSKIEPSASINIAIFEVLDALAHEQYSRYGDPKMEEDNIFAVELRDDLPGQPREIAHKIAQMELGESAILKIDHIFLTHNSMQLRPCSRIAIKSKSPRPAPATTPSAIPAGSVSPDSNVIIEGDRPASTEPTALAPQAIQSHPADQPLRQNSPQPYIKQQVTGQPNTAQQNIRIHEELIPGSNQIRRRMFINDLEVNPETLQPFPSTSLPAGR